LVYLFHREIVHEMKPVRRFFPCSHLEESFESGRGDVVVFRGGGRCLVGESGFGQQEGKGFPEFPGQLHGDIFQEDADLGEGNGAFFQLVGKIHVVARASPSSLETGGKLVASGRKLQQAFLRNLCIFPFRVSHAQEAGFVRKEEMNVLDVVLDCLLVKWFQEGNDRFSISFAGFRVFPCLQKRLLHLWNLKFAVKQETGKILVRRGKCLHLHLDLLDLIADKHIVFLPVRAHEQENRERLEYNQQKENASVRGELFLEQQITLFPW